MSSIALEAQKRRTFAIISHPDLSLKVSLPPKGGL
jgi:peptide subunit release factor RF-3